MQSQTLERSEQPDTEEQYSSRPTVKTASRDHAEFVLDRLGYVEPMKLGVYQLRQATVKLPATSDHTSCRV